MKGFIDKLIEKLNEITEPVRPVGWSRKIEVVETKAVIGIANQLVEEYNNGWIPADMEVPPNNNYVLVSFENFNLPDIARYEEDSAGGAFYPGDEEKSYASFGLFVNAWQPLPDQYKPKEQEEEQPGFKQDLDNVKQEPKTRIECIRSMSVEEMADAIMKNDIIAMEIDFCQRFDECFDNVPEEECRKCLIKWLNSPEQKAKVPTKHFNSRFNTVM